VENARLENTGTSRVWVERYNTIQASADAGAATVNATAADETDNCEVCLVAQREPCFALVPCSHQQFLRSTEVISYL